MPTREDISTSQNVEPLWAGRGRRHISVLPRKKTDLRMWGFDPKYSRVTSRQSSSLCASEPSTLSSSWCPHAGTMGSTIPICPIVAIAVVTNGRSSHGQLRVSIQFCFLILSLPTLTNGNTIPHPRTGRSGCPFIASVHIQAPIECPTSTNSSSGCLSCIAWSSDARCTASSGRLTSLASAGSVGKPSIDTAETDTLPPSVSYIILAVLT
mmetsp:Transcript_16057/g.37094  ORF Transcript_16057/g.37094 Transcript_16057/m.37094 type:complete len:210 (+) Transcript_16057:739-1368(+)